MVDDIVARLRKQMANASHSDRKYERPMSWDDADALLLEIDRLRAALEKIANGSRDAGLSYLELFVELKLEARAALEGEKADV